MDWSQQVQVYVSWVNSQLRKNAALVPIKELNDLSMCDGTVLAQLIELVAGMPVANIFSHPSDSSEKLRNIGSILKFMQSHRVKMHAIESQAVVDGDLKSIMRIVLALAAHFKPRSVRPNPSVAAIMQGAAVSLANTKHKVLRSPSITDKRFDFASRSPSFEYRSRLPACRDEELETIDRSVSKPISIAPRAPSIGSTPDTPSAKEVDSGFHVTPSSAPSGASISRPEAQPVSDPGISDDLLNELNETRSLLEQLQEVLLAASPIDTNRQSDAQTETIDTLPSNNPGKQSQQPSDHLLRSMEDEIRQRDDRLFSQEIRLRQAMMRADSSQQEVADLRRRLADREVALAAQQEQTDRLQSHVTSLTRDLELAVEERCRLSRDLAKSSDEREKVSRDLHERISELECRMLHPGNSNISSVVVDLEHRAIVFGECVERLRSTLAANDPLHHTLDKLEHCFHYQAAAVAATVPPPPPPRSGAARKTPNRPSSLELVRDIKRQPITALQGFPIQRLDHSVDDERSTKLLYYTDKTVTPYMVIIPKKLKEIRLSDVRRATSQHSRPQPGSNRLRYVFKTHDSEFGTAVKEEVRHEDDLVPVWEDKIIAWITDLPETVMPHG